MTRTCAHCSASFELRGGRGRPREYCGPDCAVAERQARARARYDVARLLGASVAAAQRCANSSRALDALRVLAGPREACTSDTGPCGYHTRAECDAARCDG